MTFNAGDLVATIRIDGMDTFGNSLKSAQSSATTTQKIIKSAATAGGQALSALGVSAVAAASAAVKAYSDWASVMAQVQSLSKANSTDMKQLSDQTLQFAQQYGINATQAAEAELELVKGGVSVTDMVNGGLAGALTLAAAGQLDVGDATSIAVSAMTQFGLKGQDVSHIADLLAAGADKALGSVQDLGNGLKYVGPVSASLGVSLEQTVGTLAELAQNGILGEQAGTSLRGMLVSLTSPSQLASDVMKKLGINVYDAKGNFVGLDGVAQQLQDHTKNLTEAQKNQALGQIFGNQQITAAQILLKGGSTAVDQWTDAVNQQGFAAEQAAGKLDSLSGDVSKLNASLKNDLVQAGSVSAPVLRQLVQGATELANAFGQVESKGLAPVASILATRLTPGFAAFSGLIDKAVTIIGTWDSSQIEAFFDKAQTYAPELAGIAAGISAMSLGTLRSIPIFGQFLPAVNPVLAMLIAIGAASPQVRAAVGDLGGALKPLIPIGQQLATILATGLNSALPITAHLIGGVVDVATPLVRILAGVPAPVLLGVAAFVALHKALGPLATDGGAVSKFFSGAVDSIKATSGIVQETGGQVGAFKIGLGLAGTAATGLGASLKAAFLANPIGLALTAISVGISLVAAAFAKAQQDTAAYNSLVDSLKSTLDTTTAATTQQTRAQVASNLVTDDSGKHTDKYAQALARVGVQSSSFVESIVGSTAAYSAMRKALEDTAISQLQTTDTQKQADSVASKLGISTDVLTRAALGNKDAQKQLSTAYDDFASNKGPGYARQYKALSDTISSTEAAIRGAVPDVSELTTEMDSQRKATKDAVDQQKQFADAVSAASDKMTDAQRSNSRLNDAIAIARDTSKDATTRLNALKEALDEIAGGTQSAAEQQADLAQSTLNLKDAFEATDDQGHKLASTLVDQSGKINLSTQAGIDLSNQISDLRDKMLAAQQAASDNAVATGRAGDAYTDAVNAADPYTQALQQLAKQAGLSDAQIAAMSGTLLGVPAVSAYTITNNGSVDANTQQVLGLIQNIESTPNKQFQVSEDTIDPIKQKLLDLGVTITQVPGTKDVSVSIPDSAYANVVAKLNTLLAPATKTITVNTVGGGGRGAAYEADGGVVSYFAGGGFARQRPVEHHVAQIAPAGAWRVWAEPETGGEAYIPLAPSKRARSLDIFAETGKRLGVQGFAGGGFSVAQIRTPPLPSIPVPGGVSAQASGAAGTPGLGRSLRGLAIQGQLDLGNGLTGIIRGVVTEALDEQGNIFDGGFTGVV